MSFDYDLFVIGGGSGGVRAARISAQYGAKVALAEEYRMGGTCVIRGCVPKKLMVYASEFPHAFELAKGYGWSIENPQFDWPTLTGRIATELTRLEAAYTRNAGNAGVEIFEERATISGPHDVTLASGKTVSAKHILVATGGRPFVPDIPGKEHVITSNEVFDLPKFPKRIAIVGGGYIASEFAGIFNGLGAEVHLIYRRDLILRGFDHDMRSHIAAGMAERGIHFHYDRDVSNVAADKTVSLGRDKVLEVDEVLYATGRVPNTDNLGLEEVGVTLKDNGAVKVDAWSQTNIPSIFAVGDATDRIQLTPVAIREGHAFADTVFGNKPTRADHNLVPTAIFTQPEGGTVGMTELEAREAHDVEIYRTKFTAMKDAFGGGSDKIFYKLIVDKATRVVLGCHMTGYGTGELIQAVAIAIKMGATKEQFDATVAVHPTASEELVTMREPVQDT